MEHSKVLMIGCFGLSEYELRLVRSVLKLTSGREHAYALSDPATNSCPDIAIIDPDNAQARAALQVLTSRANALNTSPPVQLLLTHAVPQDQSKCYLLQPFAPTKMLAMLDRIADEIAKFEPAAKPAPAVPVPLGPASGAQYETVSIFAPNTYRALVIDDSPTVRKKLELELRSLNIEADCADSGERGLALLGQKSYDIIFLDIVLPGADGYDICKAIKRSPTSKRIPVVMLTSKSSPFDRIRGSLAGCSNYLTKPVEYSKFHMVVEKCLTGSEAPQTIMMNHRLAEVT
jgi:two-component system cell cycle response regulator